MGGALVGVMLTAAVAGPPVPLVTGNGHGFQLFDRVEHRVKAFFDHPYRFVAPADATRKAGVPARQLAHDAYFGVYTGNFGHWLTDATLEEVEDESNVIHARFDVAGLKVDTWAFSPFGFEGNALVMRIRVTNEMVASAEVRLFHKTNLRLGSFRPVPNAADEAITSGTDPGEGVVETGPGGGHAAVLPIGGIDGVGCGPDPVVYQQMLDGGAVLGTGTCSGADRVPVLRRDGTLATGASLDWGVAILFVDDDPSHPQAAFFKDSHTISEVKAAWSAFLAGRTAEALHTDVLKAWEAWRSHKEPADLTASERAVWRQSEAVLRMAQVREAATPFRRNHGMTLASLPAGEWHIGWVRDATYAAVALAAIGHAAEAKAALEFMLGTEGGFFGKPGFLEKPYRVSAARYFGNGMEEGDHNEDGPNIETDGWGLVLWAARQVVEAGCDLAWLDSKTWKGGTVYEALAEVAADIQAHIADDLPEADTSIWEVHWDYRQVFTFTAAAQARGLLDFAALAEARGDTARAASARAAGEAMRAAIASKLVSPGGGLVSHRGVAFSPIHVDGAAIEALSFGLVDDAVAAATLTDFAKLVTPQGGYRRLEPKLSLTGEAGANTYDLAEWIWLDLRIADAWRRAGDVTKADVLLDKVTAIATANSGLIPELLDPNDGQPTGAIPMVGYGAGTWILSQLGKRGWALPAAGAPLACGSPPLPDVPPVAEPEPPAAPEPQVAAEPHDEPPVVSERAPPAPPAAESGGCAEGQGGGSGLLCFMLLAILLARRP